MAAGKYSFIIEQGATTNFQINWNDETGSAVDLTGYHARMQIRNSYDSSPLLSLSSSLSTCISKLGISWSSSLLLLSSSSLS